MTSDMICVWTLLFLVIDAQMFNEFPDSTSTECKDGEYNLPWIYGVSPNDASIVEWKKDGTNMLQWVVPFGTYTYNTAGGYTASKIVHNDNGNITIKILDSSDAGIYVCEVTYAVTGAIVTSPGVTLAISSCTPSSEGPSDLAIAGYTILAVVLVAFLGFVTYIIVKKIIPEYCSSRSNDKPIVEETKAGSEFTLLPDLKEIRNIKKVTWRHEGKQVTIGNIKYNVRNLDDPSLIIGWISLDDSGKWQCELEINNQKQTKIIDIQLQVNVNTYNAAVGKKVQLLDYIKKSKDFLSVTWYHQNKEISTNEEKYQGGEILAPALVVCQLTKEDAGEYKCIIKFEDFTVAIPVKLDVQANPKLEPMA